MSILKDMIEEEIISFFVEKISNIRNVGQTVAHIVVGPQDWLHMREVYNFFEIEKNKDRFEKGCCAKIWGAQIWLSPKAEEIKLYNNNQLNLLKKDHPEIIKAIKKLRI